MLDPSFTDAIIGAWRRDESHPRKGRAKRDLPPVPIIRHLLDEAFLATLRDEEGQPIKFAVALAQDGEIETLSGPAMRSLLRFEQITPFSAAALAKVAPAFDPVLTTILVVWGAKTDTMMIWGVWLHAPSLNPFTRVPVGVEGTPSGRPDFFTLISKGRASVAVTRGNSLIGTLQAGHFSPAKPTPFSSHSLGQHVYASVRNDPIYVEMGMSYWYFTRDALEVLLSEASVRGHGGTIVLLPSEVFPAESCYASKYKLRSSFGLQLTLRKCIEAQNSFEKSIAYRKVANETLQRISQLSTVDGALIMSFAFEVKAFGATLKAPPTAATPVIGPDGFGQEIGGPFDINRYGTRHRSAMDFAAAVEGSIVFVISQDGPIRAFRRADDQSIHVWPDCTASMFV